MPLISVLSIRPKYDCQKHGQPEPIRRANFLDPTLRTANIGRKHHGKEIDIQDGDESQTSEG
jgi:hypothetical protein